MAESFLFKHFSINQEHCAMKIGVDSVLLGAWVKSGTYSNILDIGTGTGLLALMMAQRFDSHIDGIEIVPNTTRQALLNIENSPWKDRISIINGDVRTFQFNRTYDLIISNPPYFATSPFNNSTTRSIARETKTLTHQELLISSKKWLSPMGILAVVLPKDISTKVIYWAWEIGLNLKRQTFVYTKKGKSPKRCLLEFSQQKIEDISYDDLYLLDESGVKTEQYVQLTEDFYL